MVGEDRATQRLTVVIAYATRPKPLNIANWFYMYTLMLRAEPSVTVLNYANFL